MGKHKRTQPGAKARSQIAALPVRWDERDGLEVLLITSRETHRWVICKGWPMKGLKDCAAAAQEAREEAGVEGRIHPEPFGSYLYWKRLADHFELCEVTIYLLEVERQLKEFREKGQRRARWFSVDDAAELVDEPGLTTAIRELKEKAALGSGR